MYAAMRTLLMRFSYHYSYRSIICINCACWFSLHIFNLTLRNHLLSIRSITRPETKHSDNKEFLYITYPQLFNKLNNILKIPSSQIFQNDQIIVLIVNKSSHILLISFINHGQLLAKHQIIQYTKQHIKAYTKFSNNSITDKTNKLI